MHHARLADLWQVHQVVGIHVHERVVHEVHPRRVSNHNSYDPSRRRSLQCEGPEQTFEGVMRSRSVKQLYELHQRWQRSQLGFMLRCDCLLA
jgi:hypothetical protein